MRYCSTALFILALCAFLSGQSRPKQEAPTQQKSNETQSTPSATSIKAQPSAEQQKRQSENSGEIPSWTDPFWSNWALVAIGVIAAWIAIVTLGDLKEQTATAKLSAEAAERGAKAALLNAQAVVNSERAWVIIRIEKTANALYKISALSRGRTPAEILFYSFDSGYQTISDMPIDPIYKGQDTITDPLLINPDSFVIKNFSAVGVYDNTPRLPDGDVFVTWGRVVYRDVVGTSDGSLTSVHESRFCFWYHPKHFFWIRGGSEKYNKTT